MTLFITDIDNNTNLQKALRAYEIDLNITSDFNLQHFSYKNFNSDIQSLNKTYTGLTVSNA